MNAPIKAVVFDADGVVLVPKRFSEHLARHYGITEEQTTPFFYGALEDCILGRADFKEVLPPFLRQWGWKRSVDDFLQEWFTVGDAVDQRVLDVVAKLRRCGLLCCLATNQEKYRIDYMKTTMRFGQLFDQIFFAAEIGYKKTSAEFYTYMERVLNLPGSQILLWDDGQDNFDTARDQGWNAELFVTFEAFEQRLGTYLEAPTEAAGRQF